MGQVAGIARNRLGAERSGGGGWSAGAVDGRGSGENLQCRGDNKSASGGVGCRRGGTGPDQRIAAMRGVEAKLAVSGIALGGVADEVADSDNLEDRQQERGEQDADTTGRRERVTAEIAGRGWHAWLDSSDGCELQGANTRRSPGIQVVTS
jgi:hypothetical protein